MDFIETCRKLISLDSTPSHGNKAVAEYVAQLCRDKGFHVEEQHESHLNLDQTNLVIRPTAQRPALEFMLQNHLDTIDPGPYVLWSDNSYNPFDAIIKDGNIYGLGTAEVKLDFLCKLEALSKFPVTTAWKLPPVLVGTYGEELGMAGILRLIRKNMVSAKMALVGEPSDMNIIHACNGFAAVEIIIPFCQAEQKFREEHNLRESTATQSRLFKGKAAHSSTPHLGENALRKLFDYLTQLPESVTIMEIDGGTSHNTIPAQAFIEIDLVLGYDDPMIRKLNRFYQVFKKLEQELMQYQDPEFYPNHPTLNLGVVRTMEDHIAIHGSCRLLPMISNEIYETWMAQLKSICDQIGAQFRVIDYKRPYRTDANSMLTRASLAELEKMGRSPQLITQPSINEAAMLSRIGIETVCFGAGKRDGNIHTPNENVSLEDLKTSVEFYQRIIERFCL